MRDNIDEIVALVGKQASLIEYGSGSSLKTRVLLEHLDDLAAYVLLQPPGYFHPANIIT